MLFAWSTMKANILYTLAFVCYGITFFLFIRLLIWKRISKKYYWNAKPTLTLPDIQMISSFEETPLPFISIMIPAKNESAVIRQTIHNAIHLNYPSNQYELLVIVDEREQIENDKKVSIHFKRVATSVTNVPFKTSALGTFLPQTIYGIFIHSFLYI